MNVSRRGFLKLSGAVAAVSGLGASLTPASAQAKDLKIRYAKETTTICPYCSVGCSIIVSTRDGKVVNTEGDPDSPINQGALCSKGGSIYQMATNINRLDKPLYRAPHSDKWEEKEWGWMLDKIAENVKKSRDASFTRTNAKGQVVNRTEGIASCGSAALDNEECFTYSKFLRALGLIYVEHQARICHSSTVPALAESFGRGAMTNHYIDIRNSDVILVMGGNPAANHPVSWKWVQDAVDKRGAKVICADPRFTQSAAKSHVYAPLRSGTDIAFLGGMIHHIIENKLYFEEYVKLYTNASFIVNSALKLPGDNKGVFSGLVGEKYDKSTWSYSTDANGVIRKDPTLRDPNCAFQLLKKHYSRYTPEMVSRICGTPVDKLIEVYELYGSTGKPDKAGTDLYAMGWTQHTVGVQNIRTMAIIQLLLGNIGIAGGGVGALRGEGNVQGSTDYGLLYHIWPGYLGTPRASMKNLAEFNDARTPKTKEANALNWWKNAPKYIASYLRTMYGTNMTVEEAYQTMPKLDDGQDCSWLVLFDQMYKEKFTGFFAWGMNPACSGAHSNKVRQALSKLDWMVNVNIYDNETGSFWRGPGIDPAKVKTEVFMLPCAASMEKEGTITNSGRWQQWRYKAANPPGVAMPDGDIMSEILFRLQDLYEKNGGPHKEAITKLTWPYGKKVGGHFHYDPRMVAKEINGVFLTDKKVENPTKKGEFREFKAGDLVPTFAWLQDDGSTTSGCWIYCGSVTDKGILPMRRNAADPTGLGLHPEWSWSWPVNRRILYNGASVDSNGKPWDPTRVVIKWDGEKWTGDVPDGAGNPGAGRPPFIMKPDGVGSLFGPGLADGPFPEHYEPLECPVDQNILSPQKHNPAIIRFDKEGVGSDLDAYSNVASCDPRYPFVCTTYRLSEHWQTGLMTRWCSWLAEMQPGNFVEMSPQLAKEKGIKNGEMCIVSSPRGEVEAVAMVTPRFKPFNIDGNEIHQVGMPWHFGWITTKDRPYNDNDKKAEVFTHGDAANHLTPTIGDANTTIPETKAFMVNVVKKGVK
ncbi:MAG: formate dehydrogenase-N subunit alpha [Smithellaceae bacterium]